MEKMYQKYKDVAEFRLIYIKEAHALDSRYASPQAKEHNITDAKTYGERCSLATAFIDNEKFTVPTVVDNMENTTNEAYSAWPDRLFVVGIDGKLVIAADRGPWGFKPALAETNKWLAEFAGETKSDGETVKPEMNQTPDSTSSR